MSSSNYSIGLQRLKPIHTAYCGLHNLAENWSWARDINGRDREETETSASRDRDETKTLTIFLEMRRRRDVGTSRDQDVKTETTTLLDDMNGVSDNNIIRAALCCNVDHSCAQSLAQS